MWLSGNIWLRLPLAHKLPAPGLWPHLPLAEDTVACGKVEGSRGHSTCLPLPLWPRGPHGKAKRAMQLWTHSFIGGAMRRVSEVPGGVAGDLEPGLPS